MFGIALKTTKQIIWYVNTMEEAVEICNFYANVYIVPVNQ
jgi:hypothetical protein